MRGVKPDMRPDGKALSKAPRAPSWMARDGKREWARVVPHLVERRVLTDADLGILESYCCAVARVREAERLIAKEGATYTAPTGPKRHPAVTIQDAAMKTARLAGNELGLSPVSRSRPSIRPDDADEGDDDLGL